VGEAALRSVAEQLVFLCGRRRIAALDESVAIALGEIDDDPLLETAR
jgi:hypothetical protein